MCQYTLALVRFWIYYADTMRKRTEKVSRGVNLNAIAITVTEILERATQLHWAIYACAVLAVVMIALTLKHWRLKRKFSEAESLLLDRSIGTHSRNWTATALNLEKKAQEPGEVARSSALTYLHLLDEAAEAWLKGSQWQDALRVTQRLLVECCHTIGKPGFGENEFRAAADLIENRLSTFADLSKAANEAPENGVRYLNDLDTMLSIHDQPVRVIQLRDLIASTSYAIESKSGRLRAKAS